MTTLALLTGHSRGLGAALLQALHARAIPTLALSRGAAATPMSGISQVALDLADSAALQGWLDGGALQRFFAPATQLLLINNAGVVEPIGALGTQAPVDIARAVALNVSAPLVLSAALAQAAAGRPLRIVHVSSGAARNAYAGWSVYCATKAALDQHARAAALDAVAGLRVCSVAPGVIDTAMQARLRATPENDFPQRERFVQLHRDAALAAPDNVAPRLLDFMLGEAFGTSPTADLRELP